MILGETQGLVGDVVDWVLDDLSEEDHVHLTKSSGVAT